MVKPCDLRPGMRTELYEVVRITGCWANDEESRATAIVRSLFDGACSRRVWNDKVVHQPCVPVLNAEDPEPRLLAKTTVILTLEHTITEGHTAKEAAEDIGRTYGDRGEFQKVYVRTCVKNRD